MSTRLGVTLYDYGVGNLHSIKKALEHSGADVTVTDQATDLLEADVIVLPGVGAFGASMRTLEEIRAPLRARLQAGTPCLAVCIGMHLLFEKSEESPGVEGIGLLQGEVHAMPKRIGKIPHLGWNTLEPPTTPVPAPGPVRASAQQGTPDWHDVLPPAGTYAYFVHSYYAEVKQGVTLATTRYGEPELEIPAIIAHKNTLATQFHPEKSSTPGLRMIRAWVQAVRRQQDGPPTSPPGRNRETAPSQEKKAKRPEGKH